MSPQELEQYLHDHIPMTRAMQIAAVESGDAALVLQAPLAPNINHHETVFGGSASALAIVAAWSLVHVRLAAAGVPGRLMVQRNTMEYLLPITGDFTAHAALPAPDAWRVFLRMLERKGKGRIEVPATLEQGGQVVGRFTGEFVAVRD